MINKILPLILSVAILSSCSSVYKSSQTPDDVYYSPAKAINAREDNSNSTKNYEEATAYNSDDRYLRMKVRDRRWSSIDDFDYWNDSRSSRNYYNYLYVDAFSLKYRLYGDYGWAYYGNHNPFYPVYYPVPYKFSNGTPSSPAPTSKSTILAYKNGNYNNSNNSNSYRPSTNTKTSINNNFGSMLKRVFTATSSNGSNNSWDRPVRTFDNSSSSTKTNSTPTNSNTTSNTSSNAGGNSGGYNSTGSSSSSGRAGKN
ncbi:MAG: vitellogenin precursor [Chitinophagaceae bacterium]|nr:vitellogenin precursor [Chitinophagaceae bacterium]